MKIIVQYNRHELDAIVKMVVENNPYAAAAGEDYVRLSILRIIQAFKDDDMQYTGTMGCLVTAVDEEEIAEDIKVVHVEFSLSAHLRCNTYDFNYITL